jgi:hypothetical protein
MQIFQNWKNSQIESTSGPKYFRGVHKPHKPLQLSFAVLQKCLLIKKNVAQVTWNEDT